MDKHKNFSHRRLFLLLVLLAEVGVLFVTIAVTPAITSAISQAITDSFTDTSKIAQSSNLVVDTTAGTVTLSTGAFVCGQNLLDTRDSQMYPTILIGSQCWMAANMNIGTRINGTADEGTDCSSASAIQKYCMSDLVSNCTNAGGLYLWGQAMCGSVAPGAQGICPTGWHIPTDNEITALERAVCVGEDCATEFPYDDTTDNYRGFGTGTVENLNMGGSSGFAADRGYDAFYGTPGKRSASSSVFCAGRLNLSSSSLWPTNNSFIWFSQIGNQEIWRGPEQRVTGLSVRCVKN